MRALLLGEGSLITGLSIKAGFQRAVRRWAGPNGVVFYADTSRAFFRGVGPALRILRKRAAARWGVVQPVGHLTVNEDGEGSNPSAPANFPNGSASSILLRWQARFGPTAPAAVHGLHIRVAHLLQVVRYQR